MFQDVTCISLNNGFAKFKISKKDNLVGVSCAAHIINKG